MLCCYTTGVMLLYYGCSAVIRRALYCYTTGVILLYDRCHTLILWVVKSITLGEQVCLTKKMTGIDPKGLSVTQKGSFCYTSRVWVSTANITLKLLFVSE